MFWGNCSFKKYFFFVTNKNLFYRLIEEYMDVRARFEKAVSEIRAMKRELREAHAQADWLELSLVSTRQEMKSRQDSSEASTNLMAARIQDLATKLV